MRQIPDEVEAYAHQTIGAAIEVHRGLGPGYHESVYELALEREFELREIPFDRQVKFALEYKGRAVGKGRVDFIIGGCLIVEIKAVDEMGFVHRAQVLSYLKATNHRLGLLINFNVPMLSAGIRRVAFSSVQPEPED